MWKLLLFLACVASLTIVSCDDSNDDWKDIGSDFVKPSSEKCKSSSSSTSSSTSSSSFSKSSSSSLSSTSSSSASKSASSSSQATSTSKTRSATSITQPASKCGLNEVFSNCTNGGCDARNCNQAGKPVPCVKLDPKNCMTGCVCQSGYLRTASGACVPQNQCNEGCGNDSNAHPGCGVNCGKTCSTYKTPNRPCILICNLNGCDCNDGYVFDPNVKKCVLPDNCTPTCGFNEVYSNCTNGGCGYRNCSQVGQPQLCIDRTSESCTKGCICASGYLRADNGTCIPQDKCPASGCRGDPNAEPGCGLHCGKTCTTYKIKNPICPRIVCPRNGCECKDGYVFDDNVNKCVLPKECITCAINEVYDVCPAPCPSRRCDIDDRLVRCAAPPQPGDPQCKPGCRCADNYARNATGTCVLREQCEPRLTCDRPNELYDSCPAPCPGQSCDVDPALVLCAPSPQYGDASCKPACRCIDGYVRNASSDCVPRDQCQTKSNCGTKPTRKTAPTKETNPTGETSPTKETNPTGETNPTKETAPTEGTEPGRGCGGNPPICGKNEVYYNCSGGCVPRRCSEIGFSLNCDKKCTPGCVCKDGYVRADNGNCIPIAHCPSCGGDKNAQQGCGNHCGNTCSTYNKQPLACPLFCIFNGCNCKKGFVYDNNIKACVRPEDCTPICQANEEYSPCINGGCDARNCSQVGKPVPCVKLDPGCCIKGCVCVKDYLRASNGTCVPKGQCKKPKCDKPNEVYDQCPAPCPPRRCDINEAVIKCAAPPKPGSPDCKPGCRCADSYYRNATGTCVPKKKCEKPLPCDGPNEVYNACPATCPPQKCGIILAAVQCMRSPEYGDPNCRPSCICIDGYVRNDDNECIPRDECPKCTGQNEYWDTCIQGCSNQTCGSINQTYFCPYQEGCKSGCRCNPGFYRNNDNVCIPEDECSNPPICRKNEVYYNCSGGCVPRQCSEIGFPLNCDKQCTPGCVCKDGYVRADNGNCIPIPDCPSCGGDKNAQQGCSNHCGNTCSSYNKRPTPCPFFCIFNGCACRKGFVYDNNIKACVKPEDCTPICQANEEYSPCINGGCDAKNCSQVGKPVPCVKLDPECCIKGCVCVKNYLRASNGTCVPKDQCTPRCYGQNEYWENCIRGCSNQTCDDINKVFHCPNQPAGECKSGCRCNQGTWRNASKVCVPQEECRPQETAITTTTEPPTTGPSPGGGGTGLTGILDGITAFTGLCLYNRMQSAPSDNIIISPMSVLKPVAMLCLYSKGPALDQCLKTLNLKDKQDIRDTYPKLDASYENPTGVNFSTAAKIYSDLKYELSDDFTTDCKVFNASAEEVDFSKNKEAADTINSWVESETNNRIQDLVSPDMLSALTRLVLVNAIYFKGTWLYEFNKNNTKEEDFYLSDGTTKKTQMMYQEIKDLDYGEVESLDCKAVRMYYKNKTSSMIVVLPNTNNGTMDLAKNLQDPANWKKINDCFSPEKVQLYLPLFKITTTTDLKDLLMKAGISDWFSPKNSGLDGILKKSEDISITEAIQKAFVEVYEEGSEAAAATAVVVTKRSLPFPPPVIKEFKANQGFLYFLRVGSIVTMCGAFNG